MQLSSFTMQVLKNFATINPNIVIKPGNQLMTMSEAKNVVGLAEISESFDQTFGVYDLGEFLRVLSLVDEPDLKFDDKHVTVNSSSGRARIKYYFSDPDMLTSPLHKIKMPEADVSFALDQPALEGLRRAAAALGHDQLAITGRDNVITLTVVDPDNSTSNAYSIDVAGQCPDSPFVFYLNISNLKIITSSYDVTISSKLISQFTTSIDDNKLTYWIALEKDSEFN